VRDCALHRVHSFYVRRRVARICSSSGNSHHIPAKARKSKLISFPPASRCLRLPAVAGLLYSPFSAPISSDRDSAPRAATELFESEIVPFCINVSIGMLVAKMKIWNGEATELESDLRMTNITATQFVSSRKMYVRKILHFLVSFFSRIHFPECACGLSREIAANVHRIYIVT